ncbi:MAG: DedA family protein [Actinomycetota bacterium]|nr:DedA family protein [Actinomycetota bacterium]
MVFDFLLELVGGSAWAYPSIAAIVAIDAFFPLVPGETSVITGAVLAANDELSVVLVFLAGAAGALAGDNVSYVLGNRVGPRVERRMFGSERARARLEWARGQLAERGSVIVVVSRFVPGGRTAVTFSAGALHYPWRRFIAADLVAAALWSGLATGIGWFGGNAYKESLWRPLLVALAAGVVVALLGEWYVRATRKRRACGT